MRGMRFDERVQLGLLAVLGSKLWVWKARVYDDQDCGNCKREEAQRFPAEPLRVTSAYREWLGYIDI